MYWTGPLHTNNPAFTITVRLYNLAAMLELDTAFSALSDPTRRAILARLAAGEQTVMELAQPFAMSQPAVSKHLRVLENAGLIARRVEGAKRPCRLAKGGVEAIDQWLAMLRKALEANYDRLDAVLSDLKPAKGRRKP
jgi:DNA-binding transcriptional ArsR family regulator